MGKIYLTECYDWSPGIYRVSHKTGYSGKGLAGCYYPAADYEELQAKLADKEKTVELHRERATAYRNEALGEKFDRCAKLIEESIANGKYSQDNRVKSLEAKLTRLVDAAKWYQEKAVSINKYLLEKKTNAVMAVVTELSLDCGNKLKAAIEAAAAKEKPNG